MKKAAIIVNFILVLFFVTTVVHAATQNNQRVVTRIPKAAKERDIVLINRFINSILKGDESEARFLATDGSDDDSGKHTNYFSEKIARLYIFNNPKVKIDAIYYGSSGKFVGKNIA